MTGQFMPVSIMGRLSVRLNWKDGVFVLTGILGKCCFPFVPLQSLESSMTKLRQVLDVQDCHHKHAFHPFFHL